MKREMKQTLKSIVNIFLQEIQASNDLNHFYRPFNIL